jgi:hypothetical protein
MSARRLLAAAVAAVLAAAPVATTGPASLAPGGRVWLHAHNCYPDEGRGANRLWRAVGAAQGPVAIEQDVAWDPVRRQAVVTHDTELSGTEPTLEAHFFTAVAPLLDRAIVDGASASWPAMVLHLDFKSHEPELHAAVWALLERHARWLTTATRVADESQVQPFTPGPLLALTEAGPGQSAVFHDAVPVGGRLLIFGSVPASALPDDLPAEARMRAAIAATPAELIPSGATNYRRWTNHAWAVVERGGPPQAGRWSAEDGRRLEALVARAHGLGLWIRFYTLNGHAANGEGWGDGYNFGALNRVKPRWEAAIAAGVDFIATDQYEAFGEQLRRTGRSAPIR